MKDFHFICGDAEGLVNMPLQVKGMRLSISLREDTEKMLLGFRCAVLMISLVIKWQKNFSMVEVILMPVAENSLSPWKKL